MRKNWFLAVIAALVCGPWIMLTAVETTAASSDVDRQIVDLRQQLERTLRLELEAELKAQPYILENWEDYVKQLKESEKYEQQARKIRAELQKLIQLKQVP